MGTLFIILPVHNRKKCTSHFLDCLHRQTFRCHRLILIDDGSSDGTAEMVRREVPDAIILRGDGSLWWGGALQKAYDWLKGQETAPGDDVLIINNDVVFDDRFLGDGVEELSHHPEALILARTHDQRTRRLIDAGMYIDWPRLAFLKNGLPDPHPINCLSTRGLFLSARVFLANGPFHPKLLPHFFSDYEYTHRAYRRGFELRCSDRLRVFGDQKNSWNREKTLFSVFCNMLTFFSVRNPSNPLHLSAFIVFCCPPAWIFPNLCRVWFSLPLKALRFFTAKYIRKKTQQSAAEGVQS